MKSLSFCLTVASGFVLGLLLCSSVRADDVTGCPLGLKKGEVWLVSRTTYLSANKVYWNADQAEDPQMTTIPDDWHSTVIKSSFRVGYGVTERLDVGMLFTYWDKDIKKQFWKNQQGQWVAKWKETEGHSFGDFWFAAKYKVISDRDWIEALAIGLGLKLDASDDCLVTQGIGTGTKDIRLSLLSHLDLGIFHNCNYVFYEFRGKVREIEVKNDQGQMVSWSKSSWNLGDKLNYKFNFEYNLNERGTFQAHLAAIGWIEFEDKDSDGDNIDDSDRYEHSLFPKIVFLPEGEEVEHRKIFLGLKVPFSVKKDFSAVFQPVLCIMWTFAGK